jgi:carbamoyl-phosphate synthase large subunit
VDTGGSNVQFALNPNDGRLTIIEMNPRVSRSSALASKATGFPIAKIAAKLAIGYTLDELGNDITDGKTPASFEPSIDYVVTKIPRFAFEKFPSADNTLTTQMKSVGEVMAIGATFASSLQKALRGLETDKSGLDPIIDINAEESINIIKKQLITAREERIFYIADAFRMGMSIDKVFDLCKIDRWFLTQIQHLVFTEEKIAGNVISEISADDLLAWKKMGFADKRLADLLNTTEVVVREKRKVLGVKPVFKRVDSCGGEFDTQTAYLYSTYDKDCEANPTGNNKIMILGGGPNRIGQGIEFDYCCVHASIALREQGYETIMVNCNPETVSTDYDTSDRLYFESLTLEDTLAIIDVENPSGIIVHYGGQTPLKLANALEQSGAKIIGTSPEAIDHAEDREQFSAMLNKLGLKQPQNGTATSQEQAFAIAESIGFPLVVRPSYVLGGRAMEIVYNQESLKTYMQTAVSVSNDAPVLLDRFLDHAIEVDIDVISDGEDIVIGGIMEHIEQAGIHSGDSACSLPPYSLPDDALDEMRKQVMQMAKELRVVGLMNTQLAYQDGEIYVIEVNPRASRTVPFVSKAINAPLAGIAAKVMAGISLKEQGFLTEIIPKHYSVKEAVFPFNKFLGVDPILGPEMRSTGEVMGIGENFSKAFDKAFLATGEVMPREGLAFVSLRKIDRDRLAKLGRELISKGFRLIATRSNQEILEQNGVECEMVNKVSEGSPHIVDKIKNDEIDLIINSTEDGQGVQDAALIRRQALIHKVPFTTTLSAAFAMLNGLGSNDELSVISLQKLHN